MKTEEKAETIKLPWHSHLISGWPLLLIAVGGLIGGACGGLAYGASVSVIKKKGVSALSYSLSVLIGVGCVFLYFAVVIGLAIAFPDLFGQ